MDTSHPSRILLWVCMVSMFGLTLFPNYGLTEALALFGYNRSQPVFKYLVDIEPQRGMFLMWTVIFIWQAMWMVYTGTLIFRPSESGHLYYSPPFMNNHIYGAFLLASILDFAWNILWGMEYIECCLILNICIIALLWFALSASLYGLRNHGQQLINEGKKKDVFLTIVLVQYGIGIYACHVCLTALLTLSEVLQYRCGVDSKTAGAISLSVIFVEITIWFALDTAFFDKYCRYFFMPYIEVIYFLSSVAVSNWNSQSPNSLFTVTIVSITVVYLAIKVTVVVYRAKKQRLFNWKGRMSSELQIYPSENDPLIDITD